MVDFFETGIDTEYFTIFIVTLALIIGIVLPLSIYHMQKPRPKIKIIYTKSNLEPPSDFFNILFLVQNIGYVVAEDVMFKASMVNKKIDTSCPENYSFDMRSFQEFQFNTKFPLKEGEKCKIKIEISWDNHTFLLKKRNSLTQEFTCDRTEYGNVELKNC